MYIIIKFNFIKVKMIFIFFDFYYINLPFQNCFYAITLKHFNVSKLIIFALVEIVNKFLKLSIFINLF